MRLSLRYALQSQSGLRPNNEDSAFAGPRLLMVADGMGGHAAGEIASSLALEQVVPLNDLPPASDPVAEMSRAVQGANEAIERRIEREAGVAGMGTTLTALLFRGAEVVVGHVGDSRAYRLRDGSLTQLTRDDTLVQALVDDGRLTPEEARRHPHRSMVLKGLTGDPVDPSIESLDVKPGDRYLVCSDGLSDYVEDEAIAEILREPDPLGCPQHLVGSALQRGSQDNVTCVVADAIEGESGFNIAITTGAPGKQAAVSR